MYFRHKKYQKWGCHGQKSEFFSNAHIYSPRQDFLVSFIFLISGFVWLESRLLDFGGGGRMHTFGLFGPHGQGRSDALTKGKIISTNKLAFHIHTYKQIFLSA